MHKTGTIMLLDRGTWEPHPDFDNIARCLREGNLRFTLYGEKLKGGWMLMRTGKTNGSRPVWMICKDADEFAESQAHRSVLEEKPNSISTGRTFEEIDQDWIRPSDKHRQQIRLFGEN
jgi:bifunctional non-homologous end joining protein LigD